MRSIAVMRSCGLLSLSVLFIPSRGTVLFEIMRIDYLLDPLPEEPRVLRISSVSPHQARLQAQGDEEVVSRPKILDDTGGEVTVHLSSCERQANRSTEPGQLVEILQRIPPITAIEVDNTSELAVKNDEVA